MTTQETDRIQADFFKALGEQNSSEALFDQIADTVYFLKDCLGRYMSVNQTLVNRCGYQSKRDLIGRSAEEVFPQPLGIQIRTQDEYVLKTASS